MDTKIRKIFVLLYPLNDFSKRMYEYIQGKLAELAPAYAVVETGGVGYLLHISLQTYSEIEGRSEVKLFTHFVVREDAQLFFGFSTKTERELFRQLISVSGVGCIVLLGQLGYVAALSGIVLAVCTLKGYELLGGRLSTKGIVIACVLMLAMTYVGYRLDWAITVAKYFEASLTDSYRAIPYLIDEEILDGGVYTGELIKLYAFTLIGAIPTIISSVKNRKMAKVTYRMQSQRAVNSTPEF